MALIITISMAERAVPSSTRVQSLLVSKNVRYSAMVSRMKPRNCGSNWPNNCDDMALSTRGSALIGPGPISRRGAGLSSSRAEAGLANRDRAGSMVGSRKMSFIVANVLEPDGNQ